MATGTGKTKKWWLIHAAAGVAAMALVVFGMKQCSDKDAERDEKELAKTELARAVCRLDSCVNVIGDAAKTIKGLQREVDSQTRIISSQNDSIAMQNDSIVVLNDSIVVLNDSLTNVNAQLADCRNSKPRPTKTRCPRQTKPAVRQSGNRRQGTSNAVVVAQQTTPAAGAAVNANVNANQNNGAIVVGNGNNVVVNSGATAAAVDTMRRVTRTRRIIVNCQVQRTY
ncbi:MAG: hypothetical protein IIV74_00570 [Alphaproteobacteria bacterium]|nr:hypothetical protein [Alphaproteobacteria bacterium]